MDAPDHAHTIPWDKYTRILCNRRIGDVFKVHKLQVLNHGSFPPHSITVTHIWRYPNVLLDYQNSFWMCRKQSYKPYL